MKKENLAIGLALASVVISIYGTITIIRALSIHHHEIDKQV
jgi:hypothetical protein